MRPNERHHRSLNGEDRGVKGTRRPFSWVRYWGKMTLGVLFIVVAIALAMLFASSLKGPHDRFTDFVRVLGFAMCGAVGGLGLLFIRWAFAESDSNR